MRVRKKTGDIRGVNDIKKFTTAATAAKRMRQPFIELHKAWNRRERFDNEIKRLGTRKEVISQRQKKANRSHQSADKELRKLLQSVIEKELEEKANPGSIEDQKNSVKLSY